MEKKITAEAKKNIVRSLVAIVLIAAIVMCVMLSLNGAFNNSKLDGGGGAR